MTSISCNRYGHYHYPCNTVAIGDVIIVILATDDVPMIILSIGVIFIVILAIDNVSIITLAPKIRD
jgi:hypothetical protein